MTATDSIPSRPVSVVSLAGYEWRGIGMDPESVEGIMAKRKSETRRIVKPQPPEAAARAVVPMFEDVLLYLDITAEVVGSVKLPYGVPGTRLYVREAYRVVRWERSVASAAYVTVEYKDGSRGSYNLQADGKAYAALLARKSPHAWMPARYMPRWAARTFLTLDAYSFEPLSYMGDRAAAAEGIEYKPGEVHEPYVLLNRFRARWDALNEARGFPFSANPWVWVIYFKRHDGEGFSREEK